MKYKKQLKSFSIYKIEEFEKYLQEMHKSGWRFVKWSVWGYCCFEQCEPENVIYQIDYNTDGNKRGKTVYTKLFEDCGWEFIQEKYCYCFFRKPESEMEGDERIFSDEKTKHQRLQRILKSEIRAELFGLGLCVFFLLLEYNFDNVNWVMALYLMISMSVIRIVLYALHYHDKKHKKQE